MQISRFSKLGYGVGNLSYGMIYQIIGSYIIFFSNVVLGINSKLVGVIVSLSVLWDSISDPIMGYVSDITYTKKLGRRHLYILIGSIGMPIVNLSMWMINPEWPENIKFVLLLVELLLLKTFVTVYATPYTALGAELSSDYNERTSIQGIKTVFFLLGLTFPTVLGMFLFFNPTPEYEIGQHNPSAYVSMGLTSSIIAVVMGMICYYSTKKYIPYLTKTTKIKEDKFNILSVIKEFIYSLNNRYYKYVVIAYLFTNISSALINSLGLHVFTYTFKLNNNGIAIVFGTLFAISIISQPLWVNISKKLDKKPTMMLGLGISILGSLIFLVLVLVKNYVEGKFYFMLPFSVITGLGTGGLYALPYSMIADSIDVEELDTGVRTEGVYYGFLTFAYKLSQAITIFFTGILLDEINFVPDAVVQPESTLLIMGLTIAFGSLFGFLVSVISYIPYDLNKNKVNQIQKKILEKSKT